MNHTCESLTRRKFSITGMFQYALACGCEPLTGLRWTLTDNMTHAPVIGINYCPWCGMKLSVGRLREFWRYIASAEVGF